MDQYVKDDVAILVDEHQDLLKKLYKKNIFITGGTGLLGSQFVLALLKANQVYRLEMGIYLLVRSFEKAQNIFGDAVLNLHLIQGDVTGKITLEEGIDYIVHGASVTSSLDFVHYPVDTIEIIVQGTKSMLEFAKEKSVSGFVYLSSLEVYGHFSERTDVEEQDFGALNPALVRSSYSEGKRLAETLCISYAHQYQLPITIARLCQTFGPGVDYHDGRVFAQFARAVIEKKDIVLHTTGGTERNYCYIRDALSGILYILLKGESAQAYNVANENTLISILEMAKFVISLDDSQQIKLVLDIQDVAKLGYNPEVKLKLKTSKLEELGWKAKVDLKTMFQRTISSMKNRKKCDE